jgi:TonB family protein
MLVLALVGLLAAPAPEALPRVPGMRFRLGMEESAVLALGSFAEIKAPDAGTLTARQGAARFFGVPGEATFYLGDGRLARVRFKATGVSRSSQDYVDGQLRRLLLHRQCERDDLAARMCDWTGPAVRVHTEMQKDGLVVRVDPWPPPPEPVADSLAAARGTRAPARGAPATPPAPAPSSPTTAGGAAPATQGRAPAAPAAPAPALTPRAVVTLPETLTISLVSRNSPDVWPRIVSSPPLHYPEDARAESIQGIVWVVAQVDPTGQVVDAWIDRGIPELDTAALAWISRARFAPCERNGAPCRFTVRVAVLFTLH